MNKFIEQLKRMDACSPAIEWIEERGIDTVQEFWKVSDRSDWMLWLLCYEYPGINVPIHTIQDIAIEFAESALPYSGSNRQTCIDCIYAAWQYLEGYLSRYELRTAAAAAFAAAAFAADAAAAATANASAAAADAADAAAFAYGAAFAANAAAIYAYAAASYTKRKQQADLIRRYIPEV